MIVPQGTATHTQNQHWWVSASCSLSWTESNVCFQQQRWTLGFSFYHLKRCVVVDPSNWLQTSKPISMCDNLHCSHAAHIHLCVTRPCKWKTAWRCTVACLVLNEVKTVGGHRFDYIYREKQSDWQPDACSKPQNSSIHPVCIFLQRGGNYKPFVRNKVAVWDILALD